MRQNDRSRTMLHTFTSLLCTLDVSWMNNPSPEGDRDMLRSHRSAVVWLGWSQDSPLLIPCLLITFILIIVIISQHYPTLTLSWAPGLWLYMHLLTYNIHQRLVSVVQQTRISNTKSPSDDALRPTPGPLQGRDHQPYLLCSPPGPLTCLGENRELNQPHTLLPNKPRSPGDTAGVCGFRWGAGAGQLAPPWGPASKGRPAGPRGLQGGQSEHRQHSLPWPGLTSGPRYPRNPFCSPFAVVSKPQTSEL